MKISYVDCRVTDEMRQIWMKQMNEERTTIAILKGIIWISKAKKRMKEEDLYLGE